MSCSCNCGCDGKYEADIGGTRCHPLIVKISHQINIDYMCMSYGVNHPSSPVVSFVDGENCTLIKSEEKDYGGIRTSTYIFALLVKPGYECSKDGDRKKCFVRFDALPPQRGWHNNPHKVGEDLRDEQPFTKYDSTNPECSVKCNAMIKDKSDSGEFYFEASSNPRISDHLGYQDDMRRTLIVDVSDGDVSVSFQRFTY